MSKKNLHSFAMGAVLAVSVCSCVQYTRAQDLRVTIPMRSELTPVQRLNRQGVESIRKQQYEKAEALFNKAYLYDPADAFTLNNLGYVAELEGQLDNALKFYRLASEQGGDALIDRSNARQLEGRPVREALVTLKDVPMRVNRMNIDAMSLLAQNQNEEADTLLQQTLKLDPHNPFTLNNLAVAEELTGDYESALRYYDAAAAVGSSEPIVVTLKNSLRGKPVSATAAQSAAELRARLQKMDNSVERAGMLTMRGVSAANRNDWATARKDFMEAYALDPNNAFTLNNRGYVAERDGDLETAQFYYGESRKAQEANEKIGLATQSAAEGQHLAVVAAASDEQVGGELSAYQEARRRANRPIELKHRDNAPVGGQQAPSAEPAPSSTPPPPSQPHS
jgi:Flp pilus assembly protein TadD